jgi:hypothetical protein
MYFVWKALEALLLAASAKLLGAGQAFLEGFVRVAGATVDI